MEDGDGKGLCTDSVSAAVPAGGIRLKLPPSPPQGLPSLPEDTKKAICELAGIGAIGAAFKSAAAASVGGSTGGGGLKSKHDVEAFSATPIVTESGTSGGYFPQLSIGTGVFNRLGPKVRLRHIHARYQIDWSYNNITSVTVPLTGAPIRCVLLKDKMAAIGLPIWGENAVNAPITFNGVTFSPQSGTGLMTFQPWNYLTKNSRYEIVHDRTHNPKWNCLALGAPNSVVVTQIGATERFELEMDLDVIVQFDTSNNILTNAFHWFFVMDTAQNDLIGPAQVGVTVVNDITFEDYQQ